MDFRFDRIRTQFEGCLRQSGVFERTVEGNHLFDTDIATKDKCKWLVVAAGISERESEEYLSGPDRQDRAAVPMSIASGGQLSMLLILRPADAASLSIPGRYVTGFSKDVDWVELRHGCYVRIDDLPNPAVRQIRWELDAVEGYKRPLEDWLLPWFDVVGCNPAHAPSHWHLNSPPIETGGRRGARVTSTPPELRLAVGLPNPLLLVLSLANWLKQPT